MQLFMMIRSCTNDTSMKYVWPVGSSKAHYEVRRYPACGATLHTN